MNEAPRHYDLHITTESIPRTSILDLPYNVEVRCERPCGWSVWSISNLSPNPSYPTLLGSEYGDKGLRLDVGGHVIVDSLTAEVPDAR